MPFPISIPFYGFKLHLPSGGSMLIPLNDMEALRFSQNISRLADEYSRLLQQKILDEGELMSLLEEVQANDFIPHSLLVKIAPARDGISYPAFELEFDYYLNERNGGYWGVLPALGLEGYGESHENLEQNLREAVRVSLIQDRRLLSVQDMVAAIWYKRVELLHQEVTLKVPSPREVDQLAERSQDNLLNNIAIPLDIDKQQVYGRKKELGQLTSMMRSKFGRNVLLVGPGGVGKTAMVWEMARKRTSLRLKGQIWETTASTMIKELSGETGWQDRLAMLCQELKDRDDVLFVRNLMELFEVGKYQGNDTSLAEYLLPYLSRGEISLISECTEEEMAAIEIRTPNYLSHFQVLRLETPPSEELEKIIIRSAQNIAQDKKIRIEEEAIREVIRLNVRFTPYAGMPGKPIRFLESILINKREKVGNKKIEVDKTEVVQYFCQDTGMPQFMVDPSIPLKPEQVKLFFHQQVFGQETAVESVIDTLIMVKAALNQTGKPIASFLFVGPTGVGKTELAKVLAEFMFSNRNRMIRFDMSEYSSYYAILRLTGLGYGAEGVLTGAVRQTPFCVLLFDEIEKAHPNFYDLLLQILGEGRLTDSQGRMVNFCSTIIIMTSNIGAEKYQRGSIGWNQSEAAGTVDQHFLSAVEQHFRPELFNRIDRVIPFRPLQLEVVRQVVDREIKQLLQREGIKFRRLDLKIDTAVKDHLAYLGYDVKYGARQLQRVIREHLFIPIAEELNAQDVEEQVSMTAMMEEDRIVIKTTLDPLGLELLIEELERNSYADYASSLRRQMSDLRECPVFIRLENELDLMERLKKRNEKAFWKDTHRARAYSTYLDIMTKTDQLAIEVEEKEMQLGLACLELGLYNPEIQNELQEWDHRLSDMKQTIIHHLDPRACYITLFGREPEQITSFYLELCRRKGFEYEAKAVWFSEAYYFGEDWLPGPGGELEYRQRLSYETTDIDPDQQSINTLSRKNNELFGIILRLTGQCAYFFFQDEGGIQKWTDEEQEWLYNVQINDGVPDMPKNIHRSRFYQKQSPRRIVEQHQIKDSLYRINRNYKAEEHLELILEELEYRLKNTINLELMV